MNNKIVQFFIVGLCVVSLGMNAVSISKINSMSNLTGSSNSTDTSSSEYVVDLSSIYGNVEDQTVLKQEILQKMEESGITFTEEDADAFIAYISEQVGVQTLTYMESVLENEVSSQTAALLEEYYAEYSLTELTDNQIMQINEEIIRELEARIDVFQQSYVLTPDDVETILNAVDLDYEISSYMYSNNYVTGDELNAFTSSWDYRISFQNYFNGAVSNAHLMSYNDTTTIVNNVRDSLYDNIKELRENVNSIENTLISVDAQLNDIMETIGMGDVGDGESISDEIATIHTNISSLLADVTNLESTKVTLSNYQEYVESTQQTIGTLNRNLTANISANEVAIAQNVSDIQANLASINANVASINTISGNLSALEVDVNLLESALADSNSSISANAAAISSAQTTIDSQGQDIATLQSDVVDVNDAVDLIRQTVQANSNDISSLQSSVSANAANITGNANNIATLQSDVGTNTTNISTNAGNIETNANNITTLQNSVNTNSTNISTLNSSLNTVSGNVNNIRVYVGSDGKLHFVNAAGADSVLPFSSGNENLSVSISTSLTLAGVGNDYKHQAFFTTTLIVKNANGEVILSKQITGNTGRVQDRSDGNCSNSGNYNLTISNL